MLLIVGDKSLPSPRRRRTVLTLTPPRALRRLALSAILLCPGVAAAQQPAAAAANANGGEWAKLPHMQLERQFAGPLQDTIVQRWRDPVDGVVCYIYLPITAAHTPPTPSGFVQYGANTIGSISCMEAGRPSARSEKRPAPEAPKQ
jgi:hypothetical protein